MIPHITLTLARCQARMRGHVRCLPLSERGQLQTAGDTVRLSVFRDLLQGEDVLRG